MNFGFVTCKAHYNKNDMSFKSSRIELLVLEKIGMASFGELAIPTTLSRI